MTKPAIALVMILTTAAAAAAQDLPADYKGVLDALGRQGDFKDGVLKVNIPRNDLTVTVAGVPTPTPFGFGGWIALTKGTGMDVMMGDLVLTQDEVNPVMSAVLAQGLDVTALHNHFFWESPRMFYMHVHGHGTPAELAKRIKPALDLIGKVSGKPEAPSTPTSTVTAGAMDTAALARIVGTAGEQNGAVYKITIGRPDLKVQEMGAAINARMGLNTWAAFFGSDANAVVAGDVAMVDTEVTPVLKALRDNGLDVVAIHHHMTATQPTVIFLHYWGQGPAQKLAAGVRAAVDQTGPRKAAVQNVLFVCEHGGAKSVIAAAHFNKIAKERGLPYRAVARGTAPDAAIPAGVTQGLAKAGLELAVDRPMMVGQGDVNAASRVVTFEVALPATISSSKAAPTDWRAVPSVSADFDVASADIKRRVEALLDELARKR